MDRTLMAIELRAERARLVGAQHALAAEINSYYPRVSGDRPLGEQAACARAEANTARIREIDADLAAIAAAEMVDQERAISDEYEQRAWETA